MTFKPARLLLALLAVIAMPAFAQNIAIVNGKPVPSSRVEPTVREIIAQSEGKQQDTPELREAVKSDLIMREVLVQEAVRAGMDKNPLVTAAMEQARRDILMQALMRDYVQKNPPTAAEMKAIYDMAKSKADDKEFHLRHILVATDAEAKAVISQLKGGAKFEELAKKSIDTGTASNGGDLPWMPASQMPKPFADAALALKKGQVTDTAVQTAGGFHVIKLEDSRAAKPFPAYEEVKPQVTQKAQQEKVQKYQEALKSKAKIVIVN